MYDFDLLMQILSEKREALLRFERATEELLLCPDERIAEQVQQRQKQIDRLEELEQRLQSACAAAEDGDSVLAAARGSCNAAEVPPELKEIYEAAVQIRGIVSRLQDSNLQASMRLESERRRIMEQIKSVNRGVGAKAAKFSAGSSDGRRNARFGNA